MSLAQRSKCYCDYWLNIYKNGRKVYGSFVMTLCKSAQLDLNPTLSLLYRNCCVNVSCLKVIFPQLSRSLATFTIQRSTVSTYWWFTFLCTSLFWKMRRDLVFFFQVIFIQPQRERERNCCGERKGWNRHGERNR